MNDLSSKLSYPLTLFIEILNFEIDNPARSPILKVCFINYPKYLFIFGISQTI